MANTKLFGLIQRNIRSIRDFVSMKDEDRQAMMRNLGPGEYQDIINVCARMPNVIMEHSVSGVFFLLN